MDKIKLEDVEKQMKQVKTSLDQILLDRKKLKKQEATLFEFHSDSLRPLRELQTVHVSSKSEQDYENLLKSVENVGSIIEKWVDRRSKSLKKQESELEEKLDHLVNIRKKLILEEKGK